MVAEWVPYVTGLGGLFAGAVVQPTIDLLKTRLTTRQARETVAANREAARATTELAASQSNRDLILKAIEWTHSDDVLTRTHGWALLDGLSNMPGLSPQDAVLFLSVTRPSIERRLSDAREAIEHRADDVTFQVNVDLAGPGSELQGGDDGGAAKGHQG